MEKLNTFRHITSFIKAQCIDPNSNQEFTVNSGLKKWASCIKKHANHCDTCKEQGPAIGYCRDCKGFIDESCYHYHQTINTWLNHDIARFGNTFRISDFMPRFACKGHTRLAESYCVNCKYIVCPKYIKRHQKKNHCLNSLKYLCLVIEAFHCSKSIAKELIKQIPKNTATESLKTYLCTIIRLVDVTLGIVPESSRIPELTKVHRIIERNTGSSNRTYAECKDVLGKLLELNEDLLKNSQYSLSPETVNERQEIFEKIKGDENQGEGKISILACCISAILSIFFIMRVLTFKALGTNGPKLNFV